MSKYDDISDWMFLANPGQTKSQFIKYIENLSKKNIQTPSYFKNPVRPRKSKSPKRSKKSPIRIKSKSPIRSKPIRPSKSPSLQGQNVRSQDTQNLIKKIKQNSGNLFCNTDVYNCMGIEDSRFTKEYVGGGAAGQVLKFFNDTATFAIKFIVKPFDDIDYIQYEYNEMVKEIQMTRSMSTSGIGPKIYKTFWVIEDEKNISRDMKKILDSIKIGYKRKNNEELDFNDNKKYLWIQMIQMDLYDTDCQTAIFTGKYNKYVKGVKNEVNVTLFNKISILKKMNELIYKQIFDYNMYCFDIKPGNFVVNIYDDQENVDVKMIDFGSDFCNTINIYDSDYNKYKYLKNQDKKQMLYISNILQILLILRKRIGKSSYGITDNQFHIFLKTLLGSDNTVMKNFIKKNINEINNIINDYVDYAIKKLKENVANPATNMIYYGFPGFDENSKTLHTKKNIVISSIMEFFI